MPLKDPEKRRAYMRDWYARTKSELRTPQRVQRETAVKLARRHELAQWLVELKHQLRCNRCGEAHPGCLQFHHPDPAAKEVTVADAVRRGWRRSRIVQEIEKCEVLCANCHAKHHAAERRQ